MVSSLHETDLHGSTHKTADAQPLHGELHDPLYAEDWKEPKSLDAPPPREGMTQRWVRVQDRKGNDNLNLNNKLREGWRARPLDSIPADYSDFPIEKHASLGDVLMVGGCVLMEMPLARAQARKRVVQKRIARQNLAVETDQEEVSRRGVVGGMAPIVRDEKMQVSRRAPRGAPVMQQD